MTRDYMDIYLKMKEQIEREVLSIVMRRHKVSSQYIRHVIEGLEPGDLTIVIGDTAVEARWAEDFYDDFPLWYLFDDDWETKEKARKEEEQRLYEETKNRIKNIEAENKERQERAEYLRLKEKYDK
jgi:hypothetical protein